MEIRLAAVKNTFKQQDLKHFPRSRIEVRLTALPRSYALDYVAAADFGRARPHASPRKLATENLLKR